MAASDPTREVLLEDFGATLQVEHDGVGVRFTMIPDTSEDASDQVHVTVTREQARKFARDVTTLARS